MPYDLGQQARFFTLLCSDTKVFFAKQQRISKQWEKVTRHICFVVLSACITAIKRLYLKRPELGAKMQLRQNQYKSVKLNGGYEYASLKDFI